MIITVMKSNYSFKTVLLMQMKKVIYLLINFMKYFLIRPNCLCCGLFIIKGAKNNLNK